MAGRPDPIRRTGTVLPTSGGAPLRKIMTGFLVFVAGYYAVLLLLPSSLANGHGGDMRWMFRYNTIITLFIAPVALALVAFGALCLTKILRDILLSNQSKIHEQSYHELISDIRMAKDDLRSKGISVD
ncbi:hypothetical protein PCANC_07267 [Puccinia coronata f. sp. avenae]|uniref:Dolichol-phosphate mannosyltransferase subunit 3 n=1 Tax=Puccinia coronata f. sp. avenae TaxID=200324 RepID=A0A2N5SZ18_9BASI|nr:hypothetical protein PCANC_12261 [Puccinia coronata f. sp. avenae]PLW23506.1 hypothetical protein PCASD_12040 [Puccinia coronata f. sp. avenae]PLW42664.1 hypothetical protein PCASD_08491 [Puccinia coronata f. sp. avenae]PLW52773.1 hypothetical protein PCANC_07267 [Puccinia coronata f. sp. avenae]